MTDDQAPAISLANLPATAEQRRAVFVIAVLLVLALAAVMAFAAAPMPRIDGFIPALQSVIFINDLITAILLFAQYSIAPSRAMLVLACSCLFTALIVVVHLLTFPGAFAPTASSARARRARHGCITSGMWRPPWACWPMRR
jgi:hypothetical protein